MSEGKLVLPDRRPSTASLQMSPPDGGETSLGERDRERTEVGASAKP